MRYEYNIIIGMRALVCFDSVPVIPPIIIFNNSSAFYLLYWYNIFIFEVQY
jgi:hypothetical protein